jgi:isopentenyl diphosphate isomerase/L-lactate dehydrogenase-like FMN-dependent dehydrogenase
LIAQARAQDAKLASAKDALAVGDFEELAHRTLPPAHWGYMASGVDDNATRDANMAGYRRIQLRPRRLVDVSKVDLRINLFGIEWESPIFLCPLGGQKMFNPDGEVAVARAAKSSKALQILSTQTSASLEDVAQALGRPPWYQLYMPQKWEDCEKLVRRVEAAGCPAMAWTIDLLGGRNTETATRLARTDTRNCLSCHVSGPTGAVTRAAGRAPMFDGLSGTGINPPSATWEHVDRLKKLTKMKLLLKGIETREDARLAREHGVDGIIVSNHGGRATEDLRPTIESLPEVVDGAGSQIPVLVDGGVRRGTDAYKALALGARAVGIGRPYIWGLTAFGQEGVERVLEILRAELQLTMRQCGTPSIAQITPARITSAQVARP